MPYYKTYVYEDDRPVLDVSPEDEWQDLNIARDVAVKGYLSLLMSGTPHIDGRVLCVTTTRGKVVDTFDVTSAEWNG